MTLVIGWEEVSIGRLSLEIFWELTFPRFMFRIWKKRIWKVFGLLKIGEDEEGWRVKILMEEKFVAKINKIKIDDFV